MMCPNAADCPFDEILREMHGDIKVLREVTERVEVHVAQTNGEVAAILRDQVGMKLEAARQSGAIGMLRGILVLGVIPVFVALVGVAGAMLLKVL